MSAAILQGVPATTVDTDLWVDLPERQYIRLMNLVVSLGGTALAPTVYVLSDGSLVNFIFKMSGLRSFEAEFKLARKLSWNGLRIPALPLERIFASKKAAGRDKDIAHLPLIGKVIKSERKSR